MKRIGWVAGLALALGALATLSAEAAPVTVGHPASSSFGGAASPSSVAINSARNRQLVFTDSAKSATLSRRHHLFVCKAGGTTCGGEYWLALHRVGTRAEFDNGVTGAVGSLGNRRMLGIVFGGARLPPRGGIAWNGGRDIASVIFLSGTWNPRTRTLLYRVRLHASTRSANPAAGRREMKSALGSPLRPHLGPTTMFVAANPPCVGYCDIANSLFELGVKINNFFSEVHTCAAGIYNNTGAPLTWVGDSKKDEDSWSANPSRSIPQAPRRYPSKDQYWGWLTTSAKVRGCWNNVTYSSPSGKVAVGVADPYRGANEWWCKTEGNLTCLGPEYVPTTARRIKCSWMCYVSNTEGNHVSIGFCVVRKGAPLGLCDDDPFEP